MSEKKNYQSWTISEEFWEAIKGDIPKTERDPKKKCVHAPGQGRKPMPARKALEGIFYVLRTGCQWKALPREYGSGSTVHRTFQKWLAAGFFEKIWAKGLEQHDELDGIGWEWQSLDGCMIKAPLALESVGKNPTDRPSALWRLFFCAFFLQHLLSPCLPLLRGYFRNRLSHSSSL